MQDKEFAAILKDEPLQPLALVPLTEEEQVSSGGPTSACVKVAPQECSSPCIPSLLTEELLHVGEQRGRAEADGKGERGRPSRRGQGAREHAGQPR